MKIIVKNKKHPNGTYFEINSIQRGAENLTKINAAISNFYSTLSGGTATVNCNSVRDINSLARFIDYVIEQKEVVIEITE